MDIVKVADRMKRDLIIAIACEQVVRPAASDLELIKCFNLGQAGLAFDLVRHSLLFSQVMALMRLWDKRSDVHSISRLISLFGDASQVEKLITRERDAKHDLRVVEMAIGEGHQEVPFSVERRDADQRVHELRTGITSWLENVKSVEGCEEIARLKKHRDEMAAHSAARTRRPPEIEPMRYDDGPQVLELTMPIVTKGYRLATGIYHDFKSTTSVWHASQYDMWQIVRKAAQGERYEPTPVSGNELLEDMQKNGATRVVVKLPGEFSPP